MVVDSIPESSFIVIASILLEKVSLLFEELERVVVPAVKVAIVVYKVVIGVVVIRAVVLSLLSAAE